MQPLPVYLRTDDDLEAPAKNAHRPALCYPREGYAQCVVNDSTRIRVLRVRPEALASSMPIPGYTAERFVASLAKISEHRPCTRAARRLIAESHPDLAETLKVTSEEEDGYRKGDTVEELADEFKTDPRRIRKLLRKLGHRAPYEDEVILRAAIKKASKGLVEKILRKR